MPVLWVTVGVLFNDHEPQTDRQTELQKPYKAICQQDLQVDYL
jgi:hypothetical protein